MWQLHYSDDVGGKVLKRFAKRHRRELLAVLDNLHTYLGHLNERILPQQIRHGFVHSEPMGIVALDQSGGGAGLREIRLYIYPHEPTEILYVLVLGDKNTQSQDIQTCQATVKEICMGERETHDDDREEV